MKCRSTEELIEELKTPPTGNHHVYYLSYGGLARRQYISQDPEKDQCLVEGGRNIYFFTPHETRTREHFGWNIYKRYMNENEYQKDESYYPFNFHQSNKEMRRSLEEILKKAKDGSVKDSFLAFTFLNHAVLIKKIHNHLLQLEAHKTMKQIFDKMKSINIVLSSYPIIFFMNFCFFESGVKTLSKDSEIMKTLFLLIATDFEKYKNQYKQTHRSSSSSIQDPRFNMMLFAKKELCVWAFETIYNIIKTTKGYFKLKYLEKMYIRLFNRKSNTQRKKKKKKKKIKKFDMKKFVQSTLFHILSEYKNDYIPTFMVFKCTNGMLESMPKIIPYFCTKNLFSVITEMFLDFRKGLVYENSSVVRGGLDRNCLSDEVFRNLFYLLALMNGEFSINHQNCWKFCTSKILDVSFKMIKNISKVRKNKNEECCFESLFFRNVLLLLYSMTQNFRNHYIVPLVYKRCKQRNFLDFTFDNNFFDVSLNDYDLKNKMIRFYLGFAVNQSTSKLFLTEYKLQICNTVIKIMRSVLLGKNNNNINHQSDNYKQQISKIDDEYQISLIRHILVISQQSEILHNLIHEIFPLKQQQHDSFFSFDRGIVNLLKDCRDVRNKSLFCKFFYVFANGPPRIQVSALTSMYLSVLCNPKLAHQYLKNQVFDRSYNESEEDNNDNNKSSSFFDFLYVKFKFDSFATLIDRQSSSPVSKSSQDQGRKNMFSNNLKRMSFVFYRVLELLHEEEFEKVKPVDEFIKENMGSMESDSISKAWQYKNCGYCQKLMARMKCSRCKTVFYCDRECQKSHWKVHRKVCQQEK